MSALTNAEKSIRAANRRTALQAASNAVSRLIQLAPGEGLSLPEYRTILENWRAETLDLADRLMPWLDADLDTETDGGGNG